MNPLKQKMTMNMKNMFWAALSMTAALVMTACSSDDNDATETLQDPSMTKSIPYTVTVGGDEATTRATVDSDNKTLRFAEGDKLYITTGDKNYPIKGVLDMQAGGEGQTKTTFNGSLYYTGEVPATLTATLLSSQQRAENQVTVNPDGSVILTYPSGDYCATIDDAVQRYSNLTATYAFNSKKFTLSQQTAFLNFVITFEDGTGVGEELTAVVSNNGSPICSAGVTTVTEKILDVDKVVAKFVLPVAAGTTLSGATVKMGDKASLTITNKTLAGQVYNVKKTQPNNPTPARPL